MFVGTWNVGNAPPSMAACSDWLARCRGHDIVAIAAQEASYPHSKRNLSPASVSERLGAAGSGSGSRETYRVERLGASTLGWLRSSKLARAAGAVAGAAAGAVTSGPFAPVGAVVGAVAGYYSSLAAAREAKVRTHWNDLVKAAAGPGYVVVQSVAFVQMRLVVLARDAIVHRVREVRVGHQATGVFNAIGNKGGMMVRVRFGDDPGMGSIAFVAAHLAAHEGAKHVSARNDDLARILRGCWESSAVRDIGEPPGDRANAVTVIRRESRREGRRESREGDEEGDEGRGLSEEGDERRGSEERDERRVFSEGDERGRGSGYTGSSNKPGPLEAAPPLLASLVTAASATAASLSAALDEATERAAETVRGAKEKGFDQRKKGKTDAASSSLRNRRIKRLGPPPPPLELLACTSHVFVFGDLNYRVDPGAASGRGWGSMWKRPGSDAPSGSIAAYAAGLASKRAKKRREKKARAEFVAERRHREAAEEARETRDDEEEEEEEEDDDQNNAREDRPKRADSTRAWKEKAAIARWVAGWHFVADAVDAAFGERTRGARAPLDDEGATPNNSAPDPPPAAASLARILAGDQLSRERRIGTALHGFREAEIAFPPTFKFEVPSRERNAEKGGGESDDAAGGGDANAASVEPSDEKKMEKEKAKARSRRRRYDEKRVPSWCDRVLVWSRPGAAPATARAYESVESVTTSDHAPVFASYRVTARRREGGGEGEGGAGGGGLALGGGEGGGLAGALAGLSVSDAASDFGSTSSTSSAFPRVRIRVASLRATLEDVDPLGPRGRDPDPDPVPDLDADGAGAREADSARRQKPQNPQNPQKPQTKPAGALAALDASAAVAASIGASAPVSITVAEALRRLRGERGGGEPSGEPSATDAPPGGAAAETNPNPPRRSTDVRPTFGGGPSGSSHPPATCAAHFAVPGGSVVDPLAPPPGAQSRAVVIARRKPTREGSEAEAALRGAEESTEESAEGSAEESAEGSASAPTEISSADAAEITWAPADLPAFALDLRPAPRRGAESRRSRRGGQRSAGGSLLEGGGPFEGGFETPDPASAFGAARARTAFERRATEVKSDANANASANASANAENHTPAGNTPSLSSPRRRGEEKGPFDPSGDEETPAFEEAPRLGADALRASVAASSLGDEALVVTLALDRDALGCATVPLTRLARRFADAAAEAEDAGAGAAAPRGLRASAHFAAPLVSFGRLRGRVEGALEMTAWTSEDEDER